MRTVVYDESFDGFLTAVFDIYHYAFGDVTISREREYQQNIFASEHIVITDRENLKESGKG